MSKIIQLQAFVSLVPSITEHDSLPGSVKKAFANDLLKTIVDVPKLLLEAGYNARNKKNLWVQEYR